MDSMNPSPRSKAARITAKVARKFRCFGGGRMDGAEFNPLIALTADKPASFAAGVDVQDVVNFVLKEAKKK